MRGFLSGGLWGLVLGGVTTAGASLVGELPARNDPPAEPQIAAPNALGDTADTPLAPQTQTAAASTAPATAPAALDAPAPASPDAMTDGLAALSDTTPAAQPETADVTGAILAPDESVLADVAITGEAPVLPNPQSIVPLAPPADAPIDVDTAPAAPLPGEAPDIVDAAPVANDAPSASTDSPDVAIVDENSPVTPQAPATLDAPAQGDTATIAGTETPDAVAVVADPVDDTTDAAPAADEVADDVAEDAADAPVDEAPVVVAIVDDEPATSLPTNASGVRVNRLSVGTAAALADAAETEAADAGADEEVFPEGTPALIRYAAEGANPDGRPEVSVILMDDGSFDGAISAVAGVSFPVSVMLNPSVPDATDRMAAYRAAGIEVGVLAALPASATASDVAVFFEAAFATLPETVAVLDAGEAGLQANQDVISQSIEALSEDGRGLVTVSRGLNSALRTAEDQGVPTGVIYRHLDAEGQDARVIRRFLDQAAFRARQESGVVLLGEIRGETISALIQWGAANRASQVAMVPISKVLIGED